MSHVSGDMPYLERMLLCKARALDTSSGVEPEPPSPDMSPVVPLVVVASVVWADDAVVVPSLPAVLSPSALDSITPVGPPAGD